MQITTIGLDIAKNVFQVLGIDAAENVSVRKQLPTVTDPSAFGSGLGRFPSGATAPSYFDLREHGLFLSRQRKTPIPRQSSTHSQTLLCMS
jgi:hypothetical protein